MDEVHLNKKSKKLLKMAREEFGKSWQPTHAELTMLAKVTTADMAYCGPSHEDDDKDNYPEFAETWHRERSIDANLIRWLCADRDARALVDPTGIKVHGAKIDGALSLENLVVYFPLAFQHCSVRAGATLSGLETPLLDFQGSWVGPLNADGIRVKSNVLLGNGFRADGEVQLMDAHIGGYLDCRGSSLINPQKDKDPKSGTALRGDGITVKGAVFLRSRFEGAVVLLDARIGGTLECQEGKFINTNGNALNLERATVAADVFLAYGFCAEGKMSLSGARIDGHLFCRDGDFSSADLWLEETSVLAISDDNKSWPKPDHLHLNGFVYRLADPGNAATRLKWLALQPEKPFYPQPYLQLAKVLGDAGDEDGRITVLVAMQDRDWALQRRGYAAQLIRWPFKVTAVYGYRPLRALWEILGLSALGWIIYRRSYLAGAVVPTDKDAYEEFKKSGQPLSYYRRFFPLIYSVENSLPLVKLGQEEKWEPDPSPESQPEKATGRPTLGAARRWPRRLRWLQSVLVFVGLHAPDDPQVPRSGVSRWGTSSRFLRWFLWVQILLGWLLATLFLAGVSGIIKKE